MAEFVSVEAEEPKVRRGSVVAVCRPTVQGYTDHAGCKRSALTKTSHSHRAFTTNPAF